MEMNFLFIFRWLNFKFCEKVQATDQLAASPTAGSKRADEKRAVELCGI